MKLFLPLIIILFMTSCGVKKKNMDTDNNPKTNNSIFGNYTITQIKNEQISKSKLTISFEENSNNVYGFAGCNNYFGSYNLENTKITFGPLAATKKYCGNDIGTKESELLAAINKSNSVKLTPDGLILLKNDSLFVKAKRVNPITKNNLTAIAYTATSRGSYLKVYITELLLTIFEDKDHSKKAIYNLKKTDWDALLCILDNMDLKNIENIAAPTDNRLYDGAAHATVAINTAKKTYNTTSFDHGNPPKELKKLVNKVLSIEEIYFKQR